MVEVVCAWTNADGSPGREHWPGYEPPAEMVAALRFVRRAQDLVGDRDCCIVAAGAVCTLTSPSTPAYALAVEATVFNAAAVGFIHRNELLPEHREAWDAAGAMSAGVGSGTGTDDLWPGHLVAVINRRWLVDTTLDQANHLGLRIPPVIVLPVTEGFLRGRATLLADLSTVAVLYQARPGDRSYRECPAWEQRADLAALAQQEAWRADRLRVQGGGLGF